MNDEKGRLRFAESLFRFFFRKFPLSTNKAISLGTLKFLTIHNPWFWAVPFLLGAITFTSATAGAQDIVPRIDVGPQVTQLYVPASTVGSVTYQPAVGGICSVKIKGNLVGFDSAFSFTPKPPNESTAFAGGRLTQAFFGIRVGISKGRVHLYAKLRPGFASFGNVILNITPPPAFSFQLGRLTQPALDAGGIVIVTISRRFAVRYDVGDTLIFYEGKVLSQGQPQIPSRTTNNLQFATGFLFRF